ncbi:MAG TPA: hypothetical protein VF572_04700 [Candidatus Saccharimonadales bacterium]|jgi:SAM-dependent methyltransferase
MKIHANGSTFAEVTSKAESVTVEFGTGDTPLFETQPNPGFDADHVYIGVNIDPLQHAFLERKVGHIAGHALLASPKKDSNPEIPIPDGSADMVYMANVFGEPDSRRVMPQFRDQAGDYHGHSDLDTKRRTLDTAVEILRPGGELVILETNTPLIRDDRTDKKHLTASFLLEGAEVDIVTDITSSSAEWLESVSRFAEPEEMWGMWSYLVIARKK